MSIFGRLRDFKAYLDNDKWNWITLSIAVAVLLFASIKAIRKGIGGIWGEYEPLVGVATLLIVVMGWLSTVLKGMEQEREIEIRVRCGKDTLTLPYRPLRSQLSRAEILGIIGMYHGEGPYPPADIRPVLEPPASGKSPLKEVIRGRSNLLVLEVSRNVYDAIKVAVRQPASAGVSRVPTQ